MYFHNNKSIDQNIDTNKSSKVQRIGEKKIVDILLNIKITSEVELGNLMKEWEAEKKKFDKIKKEISDCVNINQCSECTRKLNKITSQNIMYIKIR